MRFRFFAVSVVVGATALLSPVAAHASPAAPTVAAHHACTRTSTGHCIQGGEFCPERDYGKSGWNAYGKRYVCKGSHSHPHWENP